jgi:hypothetical protein
MTRFVFSNGRRAAPIIPLTNPNQLVQKGYYDSKDVYYLDKRASCMNVRYTINTRSIPPKRDNTSIHPAPPLFIAPWHNHSQVPVHQPTSHLQMSKNLQNHSPHRSLILVHLPMEDYKPGSPSQEASALSLRALDG